MLAVNPGEDEVPRYSRKSKLQHLRTDNKFTAVTSDGIRIFI